MKQLLLILLINTCLAVTGSAVSKSDVQDLAKLPVEVADKLKQKFEDSKEYTEEQMETITRCLEKSGIQPIINCLSDDGLENAFEIGYVIRDEMGNLRDRVCGGGKPLDKDRCEQLKNDIKGMGNQIKDKWSKTIAGGQAYLEKRTELIRLKKKICDKINQEGCWSWLNQRLDIYCKPADFKDKMDELKKCRLNVAQDVWKKVEAKR